MAETITTPHITIEDLTMGYGDFILMRDLNFVINRGDIFIIMGGSGCGKSTLMKILIGLKAPAVGRVLYDGESLWDADPEGRKQILQQVGVMYQSGALWSSMTLGENVALPMEQFTNLDTRQIGEMVSLKLALVGLAGFEEYYPSEISGGMRKRAAIARAMALDPDILFLDEPSAGLDPVSARMLDDLILELNQSLGNTVVIVTHELASIFAIGSNSVYLDTEIRTLSAVGDPKVLRGTSENRNVRRFLSRGEEAGPAGHIQPI